MRCSLSGVVSALVLVVAAPAAADDLRTRPKTSRRSCDRHG